MESFDKTIVLVTGGTRGIGAAISRAFLAAGALVTAVYRGNEEKALAFKESCDETVRGNIELRQLDVANEDAVAACYQDMTDRGEEPRILVNNAGIRRDRVLAMMTLEEWQDVLDTNLRGTFLMSKYAVQSMMPARYGRIITITSPSGQIGFAGQANYAASKAGQVALTRSLARETATRGITVNAVSPGYIDTDLLADLTPEQRKEYTRQVPLRRFGKPEEVAHAVLFLAGQKASYITGSVLDVTGGL